MPRGSLGEPFLTLLDASRCLRGSPGVPLGTFGLPLGALGPPWVAKGPPRGCSGQKNPATGRTFGIGSIFFIRFWSTFGTIFGVFFDLFGSSWEPKCYRDKTKRDETRRDETKRFSSRFRVDFEAWRGTFRTQNESIFDSRSDVRADERFLKNLCFT